MSDQFIVSARKYRPQNFSSVIGQAHITTTLKNAINQQQLAHAFLFCGPRGVGKTTCARILAKTINCQNRTKDGEACNTCDSCVSFEKGSSFNIHELDAASNNGVDDIRGLVEQVRYAPQAGQYKVYIIDEVHMLSSGAFNAFLKTLEEPPHYAIFILATTEKHKILPTILSRCQIFDFKRITTNDTVEHLQEIAKKEKIKAEPAALHVIAQKSEGCLRDALSILDKIVSFTEGKITYANTLEHLNILDEDYYFKWLECMLAQQVADAMLIFDEINSKGFEGDTILEGFAEFVRNLLVCTDAKSARLLEVPEDFKGRYVEKANSIDAGWLLTALNLTADAGIQFRQARNKKLHIELWLIKMSFLQSALRILPEQTGGAKKKLTETTKAVAFRSLPIIEIKEQPKAASTVSDKQDTIIQEPQLIIDTGISQQKPVQKKQPIIPVSTEDSVSPITVKIGSLSKIREKIAGKAASEIQSQILTEETMQSAWNAYLDTLKSNSNHSAVTSFKLAKLRLTNELNFDIVADNVIQMKFIEAERTSLILHFQQYFNNPQIRFQYILEEPQKTETDDSAVRKLSQKELYQQLSEQYPLVKALKEKLKLNIGY